MATGQPFVRRRTRLLADAGFGSDRFQVSAQHLPTIVVSANDEESAKKAALKKWGATATDFPLTIVKLGN